MLLHQAAQGLCCDYGEHRRHDGTGDPLEPVPATHCEQGGEAGQDAGDGQIGAAKWGHRQVRLSALKTRQPLVGEP